MKLVTYNIQYSKGQDDKFSLIRIAEVLQDADIACIQEVERFWQRSGFIDQPQALSSFLPNFFTIFGTALDVNASIKNKYGQIFNMRRQFGNMILSKYPIISSRNFPLPKEGVGPIHSIQRALLEAVIDIPDMGPTRIYNTHLSHRDSESRFPQLELMIKIINRAPFEKGAWSGEHTDEGWTEGEKPPMPSQFILMGDMNCNIDSEEYKEITTEENFYDTWKNNEKNIDRVTNSSGESIDHCYASHELIEKVKNTYIDKIPKGSDHYPLWVEIE